MPSLLNLKLFMNKKSEKPVLNFLNVCFLIKHQHNQNLKNVLNWKWINQVKYKYSHGYVCVWLQSVGLKHIFSSFNISIIYIIHSSFNIVDNLFAATSKLIAKLPRDVLWYIVDVSASSIQCFYSSWILEINNISFWHLSKICLMFYFENNLPQSYTLRKGFSQNCLEMKLIEMI